MALVLILVDPLAPAAYDLSGFCDLPALAEQQEATGWASTLDITARSYAVGSGTIPVVPVPGQQVVFGDDAAYPGNPDPWRYLYVGRLGSVVNTDRPDGLAYTLKCVDFLGELNTPLTDLVFTGADQPTDTDRVQALFAGAGLPGVWDATTYVTGPFVFYDAATETPYSGKVVDILGQIAADPGAGGIPPRRWFVSAAWTNPAAYASGLTRYVQYFAATGLPADPVPLTDDPSGQADYVADAFTRGNSSTSLGSADTGQAWSALHGTWGINSFYAYQPVGSADAVAIIESTIADAVIEVTLHTVAADAGIAARVSTDTGGNLWKGWIWIAQPASSRYALYKRQAGNYGLIATLAVTPTNGDLLRLTLAGSVLTGEVVRSGSSLGTVGTTDSFQAGATWHGLIAVSGPSLARWAAFRVAGAGVRYDTGWTDTEDGLTLGNVVQVAGPPAAPIPVSWDTVTQPPANADTALGRVTKTGGTDGAWDAGATTLQTSAGEGGDLIWTLDGSAFAADTFQRPDSDFLGGLESGQDWQRSNAAFHWGVRGNAAACITAGASGMGAAWVDAGAATCVIECTLAVVQTSAARVVARLTDADNCLLVLPAASRYELYRRQSGSLTLLGYGGGTPANGDVIKIALADSAVQVYLNGAGPVISVTETFNQHATRHGIGTIAGGTTARWGPFSIRQPYSTRVVGWRTGASSGTRQTPDFGVHFGADRQAQPTEGGSLTGSPRTYAAGDSYRVRLAHVLLNASPWERWEVYYAYRAATDAHWTDWYTSFTYPDVTGHVYHADVALWHAGATISGLMARIQTTNLFLDTPSLAQFGVWPAGSPISDSSLDTYPKRLAQAQAYFAQNGGLRKSYVLTVRRDPPYRAGTQVLFTCGRLGIRNARKAVVQAKVDRSGGSRALGGWLYTLTLDAPPRFGLIADRTAWLGRGPDGVVTPTAPTGLGQTGPGLPDSGNQHSIVPFAWDPPTTEAQWIDLWAEPTQGDGDVMQQFPAHSQGGTLPLTFLRPYRVRARFWPYAGAAGPWCAPVDAVGGLPGLPDPPTDLAQAQSGYYAKGDAWVTVSFTPPGSLPPQYEVRWWLDGTMPRQQTFAGNAEVTPQLPVTRNFTYNVEIRSRNAAGNGRWSTACTVRVRTIGPAPPPPGATGEDGSVDGWVDPRDGTVALATDVAYRSGASFALTPAVSTMTTLPSAGLQAVTPGTWVQYGIAAALLDGSTDTAAELDLIWGSDDGTPLLTTSIPLTPLPSGVTLSDDSGDVLTDDDGDILTTLPALGIWEDQVQVPTSIDGLKTLLSAVLVTASLTLAGTVYADVYIPPQPALTAPAYTPASVTTPALADGATTADKIASGAVTNGKIAAGAVTSAKIANGAVGDAQIGTLTDATKVRLDLETNPEYLYDAAAHYRGVWTYNSVTDQLRLVADNPTSDTAFVLGAGRGRVIMQDGIGTLIWGSVNYKPQAVSADTTLDSTASTIHADASSANLTLTLPAIVATWAGREYRAVKTDSSGHTVTLAADAADTIDGASTYVLSSQYSSVIIEANDTHTWYILGSH